MLSRIDLIKLLYTVFVNTFDLYNEYNICLNSFLNDLEFSCFYLSEQYRQTIKHLFVS